ncbi:putative membrane protein, partial [Chlamydia psittaci 08-2626_L3]|jgi:14-3-3 protein epsilon
MSSL